MATAWAISLRRANRLHLAKLTDTLGSVGRRERMTFAPMSDAQIAAYVASGEPMGKAGAYGVQGRAAAYIAKISGSYSGIMGLPVYETANLLRAAGFDL